MRAGFRADFGESKGMKEGGWGILVCPRKSAVFAPPGDVRRLSVVTSMALRCQLDPPRNESGCGWGKATLHAPRARDGVGR